eukprot:1288032-Rhodomonas_salina.1
MLPLSAHLASVWTYQEGMKCLGGAQVISASALCEQCKPRGTNSAYGGTDSANAGTEAQY